MASKGATVGACGAAEVSTRAPVRKPSYWMICTHRGTLDLHFCGYCEAVAVDKAVDNRVDNFGDKTRAIPRRAWISRLTSDDKVAGSLSFGTCFTALEVSRGTTAGATRCPAPTNCCKGALF